LHKLVNQSIRWHHECLLSLCWPTRHVYWDCKLHYKTKWSASTLLVGQLV